MAPIRPTVSFPPRRDTPALRGQALEYWLQRHKWTQTGFANASGILRPALNRYLVGSSDLANMSQELVERLLTTMQMSDVEAISYFGIPPEALVRWRTFRLPPLGQGAVQTDSNHLRTIPLHSGLKGELMVEASTGARMILTVDDRITTGLMVTRFTGGLWVMLVNEGERVPGEVQGGFVSIQTM